MRDQPHRRARQKRDERNSLTTNGGRVDVHGRRVRQVRLETFDRSHTSYRPLRNHAQKRNHRQAAVLDLLHSRRRRVHSRRVKRKVRPQSTLASLHETANSQRFQNTHNDNLRDDQRLKVNVVIRRARFPKFRQARVRIRRQDADSRVHRPSAVHQFRFLQVRQRLFVRTQS